MSPVPTRIFFPNFRLFLKLKPPPNVRVDHLLPDDTFETDTIVVQTEPRITKPEIKQFMEKMYNLDIVKVNTLNVMHKRKKKQGYPKNTKEYKKAYVQLSSPVTLPLRPRIPSDFLKET
mmetsp:Transcript_13920/g.37360  ORF Transcript_13920/g.37360 Transcript_13920/m.37360 type:complete len:119 (+) Transcript_13920:86-442(+)